MNIELKNVWYKYEGSPSWVLRNISTAFRSRETVCIVGPNGSGKTTFMKVASLLYKPTKGEVLVDNVSFWGLSERLKTEIRRRIVYVHEKPILLRGSVIDNITYGLTIRGIDVGKAFEQALNYLRMFKLESIANEHTYRLSLGQAQLVAIIRAIIVNPTMIFFDEVLANIDDERKSIVFNLMTELRDRGVGIVISTHNDIAKLVDADRVIAINNGELASLPP